MRLGEFRTKTRDLDNKLIIKISTYDQEKGVQIYDAEIDIVNDHELYLRIIWKKIY